MIALVVLLSLSLTFAEGKDCCKKGGGPKCDSAQKASTDQNGDNPTKAVACNHSADAPCDMDKAAAGTATQTGTDGNAEKCDHKKSWWKVWGSKDKDCCKNATP